MSTLRPLIWLACAISALVLDGCNQGTNSPRKSESSPARHPIGNQLTLLEFRVGNIWGSGYTVRVFPEEYLLLEHKKCPEAKRKIGGDDPDAEGICVIRIDKGQSERFEGAMAPFRRYAVPLNSYSLDAPDKRPDGKPCRSNITDQDLVSLIWTGTQGSQIATFYTGCDQQEFAGFYDAFRHVTDGLPIEAMIAKR
jgi:hypothetical protein